MPDNGPLKVDDSRLLRQHLRSHPDASAEGRFGEPNSKFCRFSERTGRCPPELEGATPDLRGQYPQVLAQLSGLLILCMVREPNGRDQRSLRLLKLP